MNALFMLKRHVFMVYDSAGNGLSFVLAVFNLGLGVLNWSQIGGVRDVTREVAHTLAVSQPQPIPSPSPEPCLPVIDPTPVLREVSVACWWSASLQLAGIGWLTLLVLVCWCVVRKTTSARSEAAPRHQETAPQRSELRSLAIAQLAAVRSRHHGGSRF